MVQSAHNTLMTSSEEPTRKPETATNSAGSQGGRPGRLHGDLLTTTLLAFLKASNAYGYELSQRLVEAGLPPFDSSAVYRTLRQLESTGAVSSFWDTSAGGPARRMYSLTQAGELFLSSWMHVFETYQAVLNDAMGGAATWRDIGTGGTEPNAQAR